MSDQYFSEHSVTEILSALENLPGSVPSHIESIAADWIIPLAQAPESDLVRVIGQMRKLGVTSEFIRYWRQAIRATRKELELLPTDSHPYFEKNGELYMRATRGQEIIEKPIASISARIESEIVDDRHGRSFMITGYTSQGIKFSFAIPVENYFNDKQLASWLLKVGGVSAIIRAGMSRHLPSAIQLLTDKMPKKIYRFTHTGWEKGQFLIPGAETENIEIELPPKLCYRINPKTDLSLGLEALDALMHAQDSEKVAILLSAAFQAPLAHLMGWRSERYGIFITGRTGAFKTSIAQLVMSIFGSGFLDENMLIRWGIGATINSIIAMSASAHDLPILIDNFKPGTGNGSRDLVNLVHAILEGGEKDRLRRDISLRTARPIYAWPIFTGEDVSTRDAATVARMLIVRFDARDEQATTSLTESQRLGMHLSAVGATWLNWLSSDEACAIYAHSIGQFSSLRDEWLTYLRSQQHQTVNPARVATNLATNQLTWYVLQQHPSFSAFAHRYAQAHADGLFQVADEMAVLTAEALEASQFLETIIELLASGRCLLLPAFKDALNNERERFIGWQDVRDSSIYLIPDVARNAVERLLGGGGLNNLSNGTLYKQIAGLDLIASHDQGRNTKNIRINNNQIIRLLHLKAEALNLNT